MLAEQMFKCIINICDILLWIFHPLLPRVHHATPILIWSRTV